MAGEVVAKVSHVELVTDVKCCLGVYQTNQIVHTTQYRDP